MKKLTADQLPPTLYDDVIAERCRRSLRRFIREAWHVVEPGARYLHNWHIDAIADHLEAVSRGQIRRLVINMPPRHAKSLLTSVFWPTWTWAWRPESRWLTASYASELAVRDAVKSRRILESEWYRRLVRGAWDLAGDQNVKSRYENTRAGHRVALGAGGAATGEGGDVVLVDDPHEAKRVQSDAERVAILEWWDLTMSTRLNDPKTGAFVIVQQRLHDRDLTGHVLAKDRGYEQLLLRTEYEVEDAKRATVLGPMTRWDPRTAAGEKLWASRVGEEEAAAAKRDLGSYGYAAQHQQRPVPAGGGIFRRTWFRFWRTLPEGRVRRLVSVDCAFKDNKTSSYVVIQVWLIAGADAYLVEQHRGHWDFTETVARVRGVAMRTRGAEVLIEDKANGPAVIASLRHEVPGIIPVEPHGSKEARAHAVSPFVESGNVYVPHPDIAGWVGGLDGRDDPETTYLGELCNFPRAPHDDQVDATTQALTRIFLIGAAVVAPIDPADGFRGDPWAAA